MAEASEMMVYEVRANLATGELVARDLSGRELARTKGNDHAAHAELARKASETLAAWYN